MKTFLRTFLKISFLGCLGIFLTGCTVIFQEGRTSDIEKIKSLKEQLEELKMTEEEYLKLKDAYAALENSLKEEIDAKKISLGIQQKGLVITVVDNVLFASGKAKVRAEAYNTLDKIVATYRDAAMNREIGIEGHTDNQPIKYSNWKSNWELSTARAISVLHYLVEKGISPEKISATGYGEFRPIAENMTEQGRQKNRRVEIVLLTEKKSNTTQAKEGVSQNQYEK
ncbi:MAG: OmpA family protein [Candidatus Omnitrophota bacterium]